MNSHGNEKYIANGTSGPNITPLIVLCLLSLGATVAANGSTVAAPKDVRFSSYNLKNVLEWRPGDGADNRTRYTVQYSIYGDEETNKKMVRWRTKRQCTDVLETFCDLSNETSDLEEAYYGRVKAVNSKGTSEWNETSRFNPKIQTTFGPPIVKVTVSERKLIIKLKGPMRWKIKNRTKEHSLAKYYPQMMYNVSIHNSMSKKTISFLLLNNSMEYGLLNYSTEFCVSAKVLFLASIFQCHSSHYQCITTAKDPFFDQISLIILGYILPSAFTLFFLTLVGCLLYHYIFGNKQKTPSNLGVLHQPPAKLLLTVNHFKISLLKTSGKEPGEAGEGPPEQCSKEPLVSRIQGSYATQTCAPPLLSQLEPIGDDSDIEADGGRSPSPAWQNLSQGLDYGFVVKALPLEKEVEEEEVVEGRPEAHGSMCVDVSSAAEGIGMQPIERLVQGNQARWISYRQQFQANGCQKEEEEEEEKEEEEEEEDVDSGESILVDWDPYRRKLQIPELSMLQMEAEQVEEERPECDRVVPADILSSVYVRQASEDSTVSEDPLTKMENNWALQINMGK